MADYQVTCILPDGSDADQRIDAIGGKGWVFLIDDAITRIERRSDSFWTRVDGNRADVIVAKRQNGRKYLKTTADGYEPNNLLALPRCP